jgi:dipeptidyl aminopeptidase/acylaminoacyl peptidase
VGGQVWIVAADGSTESALTESPVQDALIPRWSPDGDRIAFMTLDVGHLWTVPAAGGQRTDMGWVGNHAWSPDGASFATLTEIDQLAIVDSASGDVLGTVDALDQAYPANPHYPSWQRLAP